MADLDSADFESLRRSTARRRGPVTLANEVRRVRTVFKYAQDNQLAALPVRFGNETKQPARKVLPAGTSKEGPPYV